MAVGSFSAGLSGSERPFHVAERHRQQPREHQHDRVQGKFGRASRISSARTSVAPARTRLRSVSGSSSAPFRRCSPRAPSRTPARPPTWPFRAAGSSSCRIRTPGARLHARRQLQLRQRGRAGVARRLLIQGYTQLDPVTGRSSRPAQPGHRRAARRRCDSPWRPRASARGPTSTPRCRHGDTFTASVQIYDALGAPTS